MTGPVRLKRGTPEYREMVIARNAAVRARPGHRERMSAALTGLVRSEETKSLIRQAQALRSGIFLNGEPVSILTAAKTLGVGRARMNRRAAELGSMQAAVDFLSTQGIRKADLKRSLCPAEVQRRERMLDFYAEEAKQNPGVFVIYMVTCVSSGRSYVGLTSRSMKQRWIDHCKDRVRDGVFQRALAKHGRNAFVIEVLDCTASEDEAVAAERRLIADLGTIAPHGYNLSTGGEMRPGCRVTAETRRKIGAASKGRVHTPESRAKMSASTRGVKKSPAHAAAVGAAKKGKPFSHAHRENLRAARARKRAQFLVEHPGWEEEVRERAKARDRAAKARLRTANKAA